MLTVWSLKTLALTGARLNTPTSVSKEGCVRAVTRS